jgi:DNA-binding NtrC family response regulator
VRELLERLVEQMVDKGILYGDAQREFERRFILRALNRSDGNLTRAAEMLGMHRNTLSRKIGRYKLDHRLQHRS